MVGMTVNAWEVPQLAYNNLRKITKEYHHLNHKITHNINLNSLAVKLAPCVLQLLYILILLRNEQYPQEVPINRSTPLPNVTI